MAQVGEEMGRQGKIKVLLFILLSLCQEAHSAPVPLLLQPGKISPPIHEGSLMGGQAKDQFSLLGVRAEKKAGGERLVIVYGDSMGKPLEGEPGYFHLSVDRAGKRLALDLAQVSRTAIDPDQLKLLLVSSQLIASSEMSMDPYDGSTSIVLHMKKPVQVKVAAPSQNGSGKLVVELREFAKDAR